MLFQVRQLDNVRMCCEADLQFVAQELCSWSVAQQGEFAGKLAGWCGIQSADDHVSQQVLQQASDVARIVLRRQFVAQLPDSLLPVDAAQHVLKAAKSHSAQQAESRRLADEQASVGQFDGLNIGNEIKDV